jgi:hypothetical protein
VVTPVKNPLPPGTAHRARLAVTPLLLWARRRLIDGVRDRAGGTRTSEWIDLEELGVAKEGRVRYVPSPWSTLRKVLPPTEVDSGDVFVDFGAGMGRVVLSAARYPFRRVVGVELSEHLADIARRNIGQSRADLRCPAVDIVTSDVLDYEIPDDLTIAYFYNPFHGSIFDTVVRNLIASVDRHPRRLRIIYRDPAEEEALLATGRVQPLRTIRGRRPTREWARAHATCLYEVTPAADAGGPSDEGSTHR